MFELWLHFFENLKLDQHLVVIVFDKESECFIKKKGLKSYFIDAKTINQIYVKRMLLIKRYLHKGYNVIHSDADAYWLKYDILKTLNLINKLSFSIGHGIPEKAIKKWGFSLCCGFYYIPNTPHSISFFEKWLFRSKIEMDDQNALNYILLEAHIKWSSNDIYKNNGSLDPFNLDIHALDYNLICRNPIFISKHTMIFHPYLNSKKEYKKYLNTLSILRKKKLLSYKNYIKKIINYQLIKLIIFTKLNSIKKLIK